MENWPSEDSSVREDCLLDKIWITSLTNDKNPGLQRKQECNSDCCVNKPYGTDLYRTESNNNGYRSSYTSGQFI